MLHIRHLFLLALIFILVRSGIAQEQTAANTLLPDIDPQDIEIKGSYRPSFPGLRRQPILGFNPKPRVFQVDPLRMPFMETPEEVAADIPVSYLDRPQEPTIELIEYPAMGRFYLQTGFGNFVTPEIRFEAESFLPNGRQWLVNLDAIGTQGHSPTNSDFAQTRNTEMMDANLNVRYRSLGTRGKYVETRLSNTFSSNYLWSDTNYFTFANEATPSTTIQNLERLFNSSSLGIEFRNQENIYSESMISADLRYTFLSAGDSDFVEMGYDVVADKQWAGSSPQKIWRMYAHSSGSQLEQTREEYWMNNELGIMLGYNNPAEFSWQVGVKGFHALDRGNVLRVYPHIRVQNSTFSMLHVQIEAGGNVENAGLFQGYDFRYLGAQNLDLRHSRHAYAQSDITFSPSDKLTFFGTVGYRSYGQFRYVSGSPATPSVYGFRYAREVDVFNTEVGTSYSVGEEHKFIVTAKAFYNAYSYDALDIPYVELSGIKASAHWRFAESFMGEIETELITGRNSELAGFDLDSIFLLNTNLEYFTGERFGIFLRGINLLNQTYYWVPGYQERPFHVMAGITLLW